MELSRDRENKLFPINYDKKLRYLACNDVGKQDCQILIVITKGSAN